MNSGSRSFWIAIAIALAFGLWLDSARRNGTVWKPRLSIFGMRGLNDSTDVRFAERSPRSQNHAANRARARLGKAVIGGVTPAAPAEASGAQPTNTAVPNLAEPNLINVDPTLANGAKKDDKKKKKKKKKKDDPIFENNLPAGPPNSESSEGKDSASGATSMGPTGGGDGFAGGAARAQIEIDEPQTLEEWLSYMLREANYDRTSKMIKKHQNGELSAEIFYEVVKQMLSDSRKNMFDYAVLALGSTASTRSFVALQAASLMQPETSELRLQARNYLKQYARIENLRYLIGVVTSTAPEETRTEAVRLIRLSAEQNLRPTRPNGPTESETQPPPASVTRQYNPVVPILTRLVQNTPAEGPLRIAASEALKRLESLLSTTVATI